MDSNKKKYPVVQALGLDAEGFTVHSVQTNQTGQIMQGLPIMLGFINDTRRFTISVYDEQGQNGRISIPETVNITINPQVSPLFDAFFTTIAEGGVLPLNSDLKLHVEERRINATAEEKLLEFKVYLRDRKDRKKGDKRRDKAEKTVNSYFFDASCVLKTIAEKHFDGADLSELNLSDITSSHVLEAERFLFKESGKAPSTLGRLTIGWNTFCTFLGTNGWNFIPQENVGREYKKDVISNDEVLKMLEYIKAQIESAESLAAQIRLKRQEIALLLGWVQGLRSCEYGNANFDDVEKHGKIVIKNSKHNGTREVALTDEALTAILELKELLSESNQYPANNGVFEKANGKNYSTATFRNWMKKVAAACDVEFGQAKTHGLRHRFAKNFNSTKGDIFMLADIMGHRSTETTRKYSVATFEDQRDAIQEVSNMARKVNLPQAS